MKITLKKSYLLYKHRKPHHSKNNLKNYAGIIEVISVLNFFTDIKFSYGHIAERLKPKAKHHRNFISATKYLGGTLRDLEFSKET